jgi:hypothetical protein
VHVLLPSFHLIHKCAIAAVQCKDREGPKRCVVGVWEGGVTDFGDYMFLGSHVCVRACKSDCPRERERDSKRGGLSICMC